MRKTFNTLNGRLNMQSPPMQLWQKAKKYGVWNPSEIDFSQDAKDYQQLTENEQKFFLQLIFSSIVSSISSWRRSGHP